MADNRLTRRDFVKTGAATAAAVAAGIAPTYTVYAGNPGNEKTDGILNYNEQMEYRRAGKTNLMVSAVSLGGHWKRVNAVVPGLFQGASWLSADLTSPDFEKNRYDVVTQCIERGINYVDACTMQEVIMYAKALKDRRDKMYLGWSWYEREGHLHEQCNVKNFMEALDESHGLSGCDQKRHPLADRVYFLEEKERPGERMPVFEDEHGTYIMNSKDLRAIEHVHRLLDIGVDCLKIEGRTKSHYYVARTAQSYRQAIDSAAAGQALDPKLIGALENLSHRGYTDGFYQRRHSDEHQNYISGSSRSHRQEFVGEVLEIDQDQGLMTIDVKNRFQVGDRLELILPDGKNREIRLTHMEDLEGKAIDAAPGNGHIVRIPSEGVCSPPALISRFL